MSFKMIAAALVGTLAVAGAAQANDQARFELRNASGQRIDMIHVSPVSSNSWGRDLLGDRVLRPGGAVVVIPGPAGCQFDVRVTYHSGGTEAFRNIDLCRTARISFANTRDYVRN